MDEDHVPWRELFAAAPVPLSVIDGNGQQVAFNQAYAELIGYEPEEVSRLDVGRLTRDDEQDWTRRYLYRVVSGELDSYETDKTFRRADGSEIAVHLTTVAVRHIPDNPLLVAAIAPLEEPSHEDPVGVRRLLDFSSDALTIIDGDGWVIEATGRRRTVLGYPTSFWGHRNIRDLIPPEEWTRIASSHPTLLTEPGAEAVDEVEIPAADGTPQTVLIRAVNCLDDPEIGGIVISTRNVTDERAAFAELARRQVNAEAIADAQTRLLATVSHELRNPLHAVRGMAELLTGEDLSPRAAELASSILRQISGLVHVTQDLLDAARLDAGRIDIERTPTHLASLINDVVALGRAGVDRRRIDVSSRIAHGTPAWVLADSGRLRQILGNLVGNAVKFTDHGAVQLVVRQEAVGHLLFSVADTGFGIPVEEQGDLFEPFRVGSTGGERRGAGLGLSIVKRLVEAMDGTLTLHSTVGIGTRFDVRIPMPTSQAPKGTQRDAAPQGLRVLVVEDNPINQRLAVSQLERLGLHAEIVGTGEDALAVLATPDAAQRFDVVLMDQQLPGIDGTETTRRIRRLAGPVSSIPIIGVSASASAAARDEFRASGMDDFLPKPASIDDLSHAIAGVQRAPTAAAEADTTTGRVASAGGTDPSSVLDASTLERLGEELGGGDIVRQLVSTFLDELAGRVAGITGPGGDPRRAAHTLKSTARLLGADALADACASVEAGTTDPRGIERCAAAAREALARWLDEG